MTSARGSERAFMTNLEGRVALVTGASQGIGRACAQELARCGARVALAARNEGKLAEVAAEIAAAGGEAAAFRLDVASEESIKAGAKAVVERFGKVEILVNNAGITRDASMPKMSLADFRAVIDVHLQGAWLGTRSAGARMREQGRGSIINISSASSGPPLSRVVTYS